MTSEQLLSFAFVSGGGGDGGWGVMAWGCGVGVWGGCNCTQTINIAGSSTHKSVLGLQCNDQSESSTSETLLDVGLYLAPAPPTTRGKAPCFIAALSRAGPPPPPLSLLLRPWSAVVMQVQTRRRRQSQSWKKLMMVGLYDDGRRKMDAGHWFFGFIQAKPTRNHLEGRVALMAYSLATFSGTHF